ncbi:MAG: flagellar biosynthetic protein FliO [Clostridiales bacterium]|nr:flagellar biosynthetic protein FliO [Clostridiales bacterium]
MQEQIFNIIIAICVIAAAYFVTIFIGRKTNALHSKRNIKVLERITVGYQHSIVVVQINIKIYIISVYSKNIELLDSYSVSKWQENIFSTDSNDRQEIENIEHFHSLKNMNEKGKLLLKKVLSRDRWKQ